LVERKRAGRRAEEQAGNADPALRSGTIAMKDVNVIRVTELKIARSLVDTPDTHNDVVSGHAISTLRTERSG
jgi:hypothetical protein